MPPTNNAVLIQCATGEHTRLLSLTQHLHKQYCERHGIDYWVPTGDEIPDLGGRRDNWLRVPLMASVVDRYEYVFWLDADTLIVGDEDLRDACPEPGFHLTWHDMSIFPDAAVYDHFCTGAIYLRRSEYAENQLAEWWTTSDEGHGWADQHSFNRLVNEESIVPHRLDPKWHSIVPHFTAPNPVVMAWHGFGNVEDRYKAMQEEIQKRFAAKPTGSLSERFTAAHNLAGSDQDAAIAEYRALLAESPMEPDILRELGHLLFNRGDLEGAENALLRSLAYEPHVGGTWCMLGAVDAAYGRHKAARSKYDRALHFAPNMPVAHWNRSLNCLLRGEYEEGWQAYRWGRVSKHRRYRFPAETEWRPGQHPKRLLVWTDMGAGDCMMFARFLPRLRALLPDTEIVWELHDGLVGLMSGQHLVDILVQMQMDGADPAGCDAHVELMDLPYLLGINDPAEFGFDEPYLRADAERVKRWELEVAEKYRGGLRIGVCWKGNPLHANDHNRSMKLSDLAPILDTGHTFYSLQYGASEDETQGLVRLDIRDWEDTAAVIDCMDLVITVDTGLCHLSGALGQSTITLLPYSGDWRWGIEGDGTPWYPSMTLVRQERLKDWTGAVCSVAARLSREPMGGRTIAK